MWKPPKICSFHDRLGLLSLLGWADAHVDVFSIGSVAAAQNGMRIGSGCGHGELEWGVLSAASWVDRSTLVVTLAHRDQGRASLAGDTSKLCVEKKIQHFIEILS